MDICEHYLEKARHYFFDNFNANDFGYVVYPFLRIYKLFGFMPMRLDPIGVLNERSRMVWDEWAVACSMVASVIYVVGFICGVRHISSTTSLEKLHENMVIAYFTTWGQLVILFVLGGYAVLNTWLNLPQLHRLISWISKMDNQLEQATGQEMNYRRMRTKLFLQFIVAFAVSASLSMVNCVVIYNGPETIDLMSGCFWFVCFFPILLLTFKEFLFYNFMFVLKTKFDVINGELTRYGGDNLLSSKRNRNDLLVISCKPRCTLDTLKHLLKIYANLADCVELLLELFAWHLFFLTTASFGVITVQGYNLFAAVIAHTLNMDSYQLTVIICWILVQIALIAINVSTCCMTGSAMSATGRLLHKINPDCGPAFEFYQIVQIFSMEVMQRKTAFTAAGFFNMDYKLITSIVAAVTTYLLIIIQFHTSMDNGSIPKSV